MLKLLKACIPYFCVFLSVLKATDVMASAQCTTPKPGYPALSFSMTNIEDKACETQINRARWLGFTSVTLSPAFYFNSDGSVTPASPAGTLESCLKHVSDLGFDVIYKPMIESRPPQRSRQTQKTLTLEDQLLSTPDATDNPWRAKFSFRPGADYQQKVFEPFLHWMETNKIQGSPLKASIVVATELHRSLTDYPKDWNNLMWNTRKRLEKDGLRNQIQIGLDPTVFASERWLAPEIRKKMSKSDCEDYQAMLWTADFFAPSVYGDFKSAGFQNDPKGSVQKVYDNVQTNFWMKALKSRGCKIGQSLIDRFTSAQSNGRDQGRSTKVAWMGEIGFAGSLSKSYLGFENPPPYNEGKAAWDNYVGKELKSEQSDFQKNAPTWIKAVLDNARGSNRDAVNFWTTGRYDLFGLSNLPPLGDLNSVEGQYTSADPTHGPDAIPAEAQIRDLLQQYTRERCPGWKPTLPPVLRKKTVALHKKRHRRVRPKVYDCVNVTTDVDVIPLESMDFDGLIDAIDAPEAPTL